MSNMADLKLENQTSTDYERVCSAGQAASLNYDELMALRPSLEDTLAWYYAQDPMYEDSTAQERQAVLGGAPEQGEYVAYIENEYQASLAYEMAGVNTIARVFRPDIFESSQQALIDISQAIIGDRLADHLSTKDVLAYCLSSGSRGLVDADLLGSALAGAEMLLMAASYNENTPQFVRDNINQMTLAKLGKVINLMQNQLTPRKERLITSAGLVGGAIYQRAIELEADGQSVELEAVKIKCAMFMASLQLNGRQRPENLADRTAQLTCLEILLKTAVNFSGPNALQRRFKGDKTLAGLLHELMWYLDFNLLLQAENDQQIVVTPAVSAHDSPKIGRPSLRRGYDFVIHRTDYVRGDHGYPVQLKSKPNPKFAKDYHPGIKVVYEQNFQDINPRSLEGKLRRYNQFLLKAVAEGRFSDGIAPVEKQLLQSVKSEYADLKAQLDNSRQEAKKLERVGAQPVNIGSVALNRAARRLLARQLKNSKP